MIAEKNKVVTFHYSLKNAEGEPMESSREKDPMTYLHGANAIIPGLEKAMEGHAVGDEFSVTVEPGYTHAPLPGSIPMTTPFCPSLSTVSSVLMIMYPAFASCSNAES